MGVRTRPWWLRDSFVFALRRRAQRIRAAWLSRHKARRPVGLAALRAGSSPYARFLRAALVPHAPSVAPPPPPAPPHGEGSIGGAAAARANARPQRRGLQAV
jgi:hypothetical protein